MDVEEESIKCFDLSRFFQQTEQTEQIEDNQEMGEISKKQVR